MSGEAVTQDGHVFGNIFEQLFAPGRKHTDDERNRLLMTRDEAGDTGPGKGPIDLDSGVVVMRPSIPGPAASGPAEDQGRDRDLEHRGGSGRRSTAGTGRDDNGGGDGEDRARDR